MAREPASKHIDGISDLVVVAPIREGFIHAYENVTYETRLRIVGEALHHVRASAREHERVSPFSDTTERILTLLDFRIGVLDRGMMELGARNRLKARRYLYLSATFDGALEPYLRLIWRPLGVFLDLLFCNCEGYVPAGDNGFRDYLRWVQGAQVESAIFYATTGLTVKDQLYLRALERSQRDLPAAGADLVLARLTMPDPELAARLARGDPPGGPPQPLAAMKANQLALEALSILYRLADYYPPDRMAGEGKYLLRAAQSLLKGWDSIQLDTSIRTVFADEIAWFERDFPPTQPMPPDPPLKRREVQSGIISSFSSAAAPVRHGALLFLTITDAVAARAFIGGILEARALHFEGDAPDAGLWRTLAFTHHGLEAIGVDNGILRAMPQEFRQGMARRASLIGDLRENHPRNWTLPERNWPPATGAETLNRPPVDPSEVHLLLQLRLAGRFADADTRLTEAIAAMAQSVEASGLRLNAVQGMTSRAGDHAADPMLTRDHFGFLDGFSQPIVSQTLPEDARQRPADHVRLGEILLGYRNDHGDFAPRGRTAAARFQRNGSFLVVRKIEQYPEQFDAFLHTESQRIAAETGTAFTPEDLAAKLVGRARDGTPAGLAGYAGGNSFDFSADPHGDGCPLAAHIRRLNPRLAPVNDPDPLQRPAPRVMRRGMSFGTPGDSANPRGLIFMAYGASIADQYEVLQRWINGGNSTAIASAQNDPLIGVRPASGPATFRFVHAGQVVRVALPAPFTRLHWGLYLFAPARTALRSIAAMGARPVVAMERPAAARGRRRLQQLRSDRTVAALEWKRILENFDTKDPRELGLTPDVMAAIRDHHGGAYRIAGSNLVIVASEPLMLEVLSTPAIFSVCEQEQRIGRTSGAIYVAMQPDARYAGEAEATNAIMLAQSESDGFAAGYGAAESVLRTLVGRYEALPPPARSDGAFKVNLRRDVLLPALGAMCTHWFGLPDGALMRNAPWSWGAEADRVARCPGDFLAPSRHAFYPHPSAAVEGYALDHGARIAKAGAAFVAEHSANRAAMPGLLSRQMALATPQLPDDVLARNIIGMMIGALPPVDGNLRAILMEWLAEDSLWQHQAALRRATGNQRADYHAASAALRGPVSRAICKRPAPDLLYRTAIADTVLLDGTPHACPVKAGDMIIISQASAAQASLFASADGAPHLAFGGYREAALQPPGAPTHACPAYRLMMGSMIGILAALLDAGRIQAMPSALIIQLSGWRTGYGQP